MSVWWRFSVLLRQWAIQRADAEDPFMGYGVLEEAQGALAPTAPEGEGG